MNSGIAKYPQTSNGCLKSLHTDRFHVRLCTMWIELPKVPLSILWSPTICDPLASLSGLLCILDILLICWFGCINRPSIAPPRYKCHFNYIFLIGTIIIHFIDTKLFYYLPVEHRPNNGEDASIMFAIGTPVYIFYLSLIAAHYRDPVSETDTERLPITILRQERSRDSIKLWKIFRFMILGGSVAVYDGILIALLVYYIVIAQVVWLFNVVFGGSMN